jgi:tetratricopeptide (TPR) repeat protein
MKAPLLLVFVNLYLFGYGQSAYKIAITQRVFDNLVLAYANSKTPPDLKIIPLQSNKQVIANYINDKAKYVIQIDEKLIDLCLGMGKDSIESLAIIISHELAHHYNNHGWCSDFAFAISKKNNNLALKLKNVTKENKLEKESLADNHSLFYAAVAGYHTFDLYSTLINKVYSAYQLSHAIKGYPTLNERKAIAKEAGRFAKQLYAYFKDGIQAINDEQYEKAIDNFNKANSHIPFRETYNNLGVAKVRMALMMKPVTIEEYEHPQRFLYPLEVDNNSRLNKDNTRGEEEDKSLKMTELLKEAQRDFQEAIRIDPAYLKGYINLACVYDLLGNPSAAIGKIKELPLNDQNSLEAKRILAIAYYHNDEVKKAEGIWNILKMN